MDPEFWLSDEGKKTPFCGIATILMGEEHVHSFKRWTKSQTLLILLWFATCIHKGITNDNTREEVCEDKGLPSEFTDPLELHLQTFWAPGKELVMGGGKGLGNCRECLSALGGRPHVQRALWSWRSWESASQNLPRCSNAQIKQLLFSPRTPSSAPGDFLKHSQ